MKPWVIFDYDDTLGGVLIDNKPHLNNEAYKRAIDFFVRCVSGEFNISQKVIRKTQHDIDVATIKENGFQELTRFAESFVKTYEVLTGKEAPSWVFDIGMSVFRYPYIALPGALRVLEALRGVFNVAVFTKGTLEEQHRKLNDSGVFPYVDHVAVANWKSFAEWSVFLEELRIGHLGSCWAVGNSIKSDVNIPLRIGLNAVHVAHEGEWIFEREPLDCPKSGCALHVVREIEEVMGYLMPETKIRSLYDDHGKTKA